jgi:hypothetical protein
VDDTDRATGEYAGEHIKSSQYRNFGHQSIASMLIQKFLVAVATTISLYSHLALGASVNIRQNGVKIMLVGDSISHGAEGDCTSKCLCHTFQHG